MSTDQALQAKGKSGGPYTKQEQEQRRAKVYELHFEKGHSAVQIAQMLDVNRNTISSDIKYWYSQMASQINGKNVVGMVLKHIDRLELQRKRLLDEVEKQTEFSSKVTLEKMILEIDNKIAGLFSKMIGKDLSIDEYEITEDISEDDLTTIVRHSIFSNDHLYPESASEDDILLDTLSMKKCDIQYAKNVLNTMKKLGLELCENSRGSDRNYDLFKFALMRGYVTKEELASYFKKRQEDRKPFPGLSSPEKKYGL